MKAQAFEDIEKNDRLIDHKNAEDLIYRRDFQTTEQFEARSNYYYWSEQMLWNAEFKSQTDQAIWECHTDGLSRRQISQRIGLDDSWCGRKIRKIREYLMCSSMSVSYG